MALGAIGLRTKLLYGFGTIAYGIKDNGFNFLLLIFYNQLLGLPAQLVGLAIMIALIIDGFSDPLIGHISDRFHSRLGRRHFFMYLSAMPCAVVYYFLWNPPSGLGTGALFWYLLITAIIVRILIALYEVPSAALLAELTEDYDLRTSLVAYRFFFGYLGAVLMGVIALSVFLRPTAQQSVGLLNRAGYHGYSIAAATLMFVSISISTAGTHHYIPYLRAPPPKRAFNLARDSREIRDALANRPLLSMIACGFFSAMALGLVATLSIYFYTYYWELSADQVSQLLLSALISAAAAFAARHTNPSGHPVAGIRQDGLCVPKGIGGNTDGIAAGRCMSACRRARPSQARNKRIFRQVGSVPLKSAASPSAAKNRFGSNSISRQSFKYR